MIGDSRCVVAGDDPVRPVNDASYNRQEPPTWRPGRIIPVAVAVGVVVAVAVAVAVAVGVGVGPPVGDTRTK